jgi:hypothetical protein
MCEDRITPYLEDILAAVLAYVDDCDLPHFCRTGLVGGNPAWDDCCDCGDGSGQLWVRLVTWEPDPEFIQPTPFGCDQPTMLTIGVGALRCVPTIDEHGNPPSASAETTSARQILHDAEVVKNAVMCSIEERFWQGWTALDYAGGCGGGEHLFLIPYPGCDCSES